MMKRNNFFSGLLLMLMVITSCSFSKEEITNKAKKLFDEQVNKIDSNLVKKIDHKVNDVDSIINQTTIKTIRSQIDEKLKGVDTLVNGLKKSVDNKQPVKEQ